MKFIDALLRVPCNAHQTNHLFQLKIYRCCRASSIHSIFIVYIIFLLLRSESRRHFNCHQDSYVCSATEKNKIKLGII